MYHIIEPVRVIFSYVINYYEVLSTLVLSTGHRNHYLHLQSTLNGSGSAKPCDIYGKKCGDLARAKGFMVFASKTSK